jgi:hypothetical protein
VDCGCDSVTLAEGMELVVEGIWREGVGDLRDRITVWIGQMLFFTTSAASKEFLEIE